MKENTEVMPEIGTPETEVMSEIGTTETELHEDLAPLPEVVESIRREYEERIVQLEAKYASEIKDRDTIITQLISGDNRDSAARRPSFVERLNNKRNFKKW